MPSKIHVAHVVYSFGTGGLEKGVATLISRSSPRFEHSVVCLAEAGDSARLLPPDTRVINCGKQPGASFKFILKLSRVLKKLQPDLVHTRNWSGMDGILGARLAGIRRVVHGEHGWGMEDPLGRNRKRLCLRRLFSMGVRELTCVSRQIETWLRREVGIRRPITQIYNGVNLFAVDKDAGSGVRHRLGLSDNAFVVGMVGRLDPIKDHLTLLRSFELLRGQAPDARLLVVGDGPERGRLEREAGAGVLFLGNRDDVPHVLKALDVFVLTSLNEGISNTILEAMAAGLPVVATRAGGNPELVLDKETGMLFPPGDVQALGRILETYLGSENLRLEHGRAGRDRVKREFTVQGMVDAYEGLYTRVVGTAG